MLVTCSITGHAQIEEGSTDTVKIVGAEEIEVRDTAHPHSVRKATLLSAVVPGAGQFYNKKYWKMPIVYAGLGTTIYLAYDNHQQYKLYLDAFYQRIDSTQTDQFENVYSTASLVQLQNIYRKWRDLSIIIGAAVYALQIIDAHVDAHLYYYNVSDDLSLRLQPGLLPNGALPAVGLNLTLHFK